MLAPDGFIRLTFAEFCALSLQQYMVWEDRELLSELVQSGVRVDCAGYCEWISATSDPQVSIGWAWFRPTALDGDNVNLAPGGLSFNVMLRSPEGFDLGVRTTEELLLTWLARQHWQESISALR